MLNVFVKESAEKLHVQLSDGRIMPLEVLVSVYERLLKEKAIIYEPKEEKTITQELKPGEWFRIDRKVINKSKEEIRQKCNKAGNLGKAYWKRFEESNKIADKNPEQYPRLIETYIFKHSWEFKTEQEMRDMCKEVGDGICDEVICDLELQMRICNGESVNDLFQKPDKLPCVRLIKRRIGGSKYFGGGVDNNDNDPPARYKSYRSNYDICHHYVPYAFRRVSRRTKHCFRLLKPKQN